MAAVLCDMVGFALSFLVWFEVRYVLLRCVCVFVIGVRGCVRCRAVCLCAVCRVPLFLRCASTCSSLDSCGKHVRGDGFSAAELAYLQAVSLYEFSPVIEVSSLYGLFKTLILISSESICSWKRPGRCFLRSSSGCCSSSIMLYCGNCQMLNAVYRLDVAFMS